MKLVAPERERALVVAVDLHDPRRPLAPELEEFEALIVATGALVAGRIVQRLPKIDAATMVGSGKAREIAERADELGANKIFVFNDLRPRQRTNLEKTIPCRSSTARWSSSTSSPNTRVVAKENCKSNSRNCAIARQT